MKRGARAYRQAAGLERLEQILEPGKCTGPGIRFEPTRQRPASNRATGGLPRLGAGNHWGIAHSYPRCVERGSLDSAPRAHGLPATMAKAENPGEELDQTGRIDLSGGGLCNHQQRALASLENSGDTAGVIQRLSGIRRGIFAAGSLDQASLLLMRRPVRTRMQGAVGRGG